MELDLKGRRALVTGGSRGIGYGVARSLAAEGCDLHLASRSAASLEAARRTLQESFPVGITTHACDLSKADNVAALARACGPLDILINNAGAIPQGTIELDDRVWREAWPTAKKIADLMSECTVMCSRPAYVATGPPIPNANVISPMCSIDE